MRNRVARVARATIATSRPKSSDSVADIDGTILSTLYGARFLRVEEHSAHQEHKKHRDLPTRLPGAPRILLLLLYYAFIVPCLSLTGQEEGMPGQGCKQRRRRPHL